MKNIEKYQNELENFENRSLVCFIAKEKVGLRCDVGECLKCEKEAFKWLLEEYKEPILNEDEKKILRGVIEAIKPFIKISPLITRYNEAYGQTLIVLSYENEDVRLPLFNRDKMFTNLGYEKSYTLKELGLC